MKREQLTEKILDIKREKGWTWKQITDEIGGMSPVLVVGALLGQMKLVKPLAKRLPACLDFRRPRSACSMRCPIAARRCRPPTR
jgi:cyanate lyase